jgi:hypothetical protein
VIKAVGGSADRSYMTDLVISFATAGVVCVWMVVATNWLS